MTKRCLLPLSLCVACLVFIVGSLGIQGAGQDKGDVPDLKSSAQPDASIEVLSLSRPAPIMTRQKMPEPWSSKILDLEQDLQRGETMAPFHVMGGGEARDGSHRPGGDARQTDHRINLRYFSFDPLTNLPAVNPGLKADPENELYLVQFWTVPIEEHQDRIRGMGGKIYRYLPERTLIVRMPAAGAGQVARLPHVRWVGEFHPAYKLDEKILDAHAKGLDAVEGSREGRGEFFTKYEYSIEVFERAGGGPVGEHLSEQGDAGMVFRAPRTSGVGASSGLGRQGEIKAFIERLGGRVSVVTPGGFRMQATLTMNQLIRVARRNDVYFIEPWGYGGTDADAP